ncbi:outer membrane protein [Filimonas lacunae]|nr:outer membrane protein [Filimonas lacunae]
MLLFFETVVAHPVIAQSQQEKKITLKQALEAVEKKFGTKFAYEHNLLEGKYTTTKALEAETVAEVLKDILYPNNLIFLYVSNNAYSIVSRSASFFKGNEQAGAPAQQAVASAGQAPGKYTVRGSVTDVIGNPLPFVNIWVKGSNNGAQTLDKGDFILANVDANDTLIFTYVGYITQRVGIDGRYTVNVQMQSDGKNSLSEVVVVSTGLQQLPKERATGSFATVTAKDLEKVPVPNVIQRLEGLVPGVKISVLAGDRSFIYGGGGTSGNGKSINSATRTVGQNDYNATIRGTGSLNAEKYPLTVLDGAITDLDISAINPADIENITFLKDAAAASIWGVRAANGVIVITTKKGRSNQVPAINFSAGFNVSGKPNLNYLRRMNSAEMINYETELVNRNLLTTALLTPSAFNYTSYPHKGAELALMLKAGTITQDAYNKSIDSLKAIDNTSQVEKYLMQSARNQQYNLSVSGGNAYSSYYYSASYSKEGTNVKRTTGDRLTLTLNNSWKLFKIATLSTSFKGSFFNYVNDGIALSSLYSTSNAHNLFPYEQIADNNGNGVNLNWYNPAFINSLAAGRPAWTYNYLNELRLNDNVQKDQNYVVNINLSVPIYRGLSASVMYTNERSYSNSRQFYDPQSFNIRNLLNQYTAPTSTTNSLGYSTSSGQLLVGNTTTNNYAVRGQLSYDKTINGIHQLNVIAGSEIRQTQIGGTAFTLMGYNMATGASVTITNGSSFPGVSGTTYWYNTGTPSQQDKVRRFLSYFSNAAYTLMGKYSLSGSVRYDDYNNFGLDRKYRATPLWSTGAKWDIYKEGFMKTYKWISSLSLRATYGVNGNVAQDQYPYTYIGTPYTDGTTGLPQSSIINPPNPQLRWEKTYVTNLGVDFGFLQNKLAGSIEVYRRNGKDLLYNLPSGPTYTGTITTLSRNVASMVNKGIEMSLRAQVFSNKDWTVSVGETFAYNTNKITDKRIDSTLGGSYIYNYSPASVPNLYGYATDKLMVYRNAGLSANGMTRVYNYKGDTVAASQVTYLRDMKYAGRTTAPYFGSVNTSIRYKQFTLYALATYQFGSVFLKPTISQYTVYSSVQVYDMSKAIASRWQKAGDENITNVPGIGVASYSSQNVNRFQYSDINVLSGDYVRLREVSLSYQFPSTGFISNVVKGMSFTATVRNLGLIWRANKEGYDPDFIGYPGRSFGLPAAKSYNFSLNVNF